MVTQYRMPETEFIVLADQTLAEIGRGLDASNAGFDWFMADSGVLEVEFDDGNKIVINRNAAVQEIWVAARSGGFHFHWDKNAWKSTRDGRELAAVLSELISSQTGACIGLPEIRLSAGTGAKYSGEQRVPGKD